MNSPAFANGDFPDWLCDEGQQVFALAKSLGGPLMVERSVKWVGDGLCQGRFLMSLPKTSLYPGPKRQLTKICSALGCEDRDVEQLIELLPFANNVHFGFEPENSSARIKCYLEFPGDNAPEKNLVFWALKWLATESQYSSVVSRYWSRVHYSKIEKSKLLCDAIPEGLVKDVMLKVFALAEKSGKPAALLEVNEPGNPRRSLDVNLSDVACLVSDLKGDLPDIVSSYFKMSEHQKIGHIASGVSRTGDAFVTFYYGAERIS